MKLYIKGMGWVTPLGNDLDEVWQKLLAGAGAITETISESLGQRSYPVFRVPASATSNLPKHPRLRRSSALSRFAAVAGLAALQNAKVELTAEAAAQTALIFAISNGGVIYTKRFYHEIIETSAKAASPLLFPETVFNAPASHLAAILGITGASYTLVGDGAVGLLALKMAEDLMQSGSCRQCLVVATEEADWLLCDAYRKWRLMRSAPPIEVFNDATPGMLLSEGAGAIFLQDGGTVVIDKIDPGSNFKRQEEAPCCMNQVFAKLATSKIDLVVSSANGTFIDESEAQAILRYCPESFVYSAKPALGDSVGVSGLWQVICACEALLKQELPPTLHPPASTRLNLTTPTVISPPSPLQSALVSACGLNQQVAGLTIRLSGAS